MMQTKGTEGQRPPTSSAQSSTDIFVSSNSALKKLQKSRKILADSLARPTANLDTWIPMSMMYVFFIFKLQ